MVALVERNISTTQPGHLSESYTFAPVMALGGLVICGNVQDTFLAKILARGNRSCADLVALLLHASEAKDT